MYSVSVNTKHGPSTPGSGGSKDMVGRNGYVP